MYDASVCNICHKPYYGWLLQTPVQKTARGTWSGFNFNGSITNGKMYSVIHRFKWTWLNSKWSASIFVTLQRRVTLLQNHLWMTLLFKVSTYFPVLYLLVGLFLPALSLSQTSPVIQSCYIHHCIIIMAFGLSLYKSGCKKIKNSNPRKSSIFLRWIVLIPFKDLKIMGSIATILFDSWMQSHNNSLYYF